MWVVCLLGNMACQLMYFLWTCLVNWPTSWGHVLSIWPTSLGHVFSVDLLLRACWLTSFLGTCQLTCFLGTCLVISVDVGLLLWEMSCQLAHFFGMYVLSVDPLFGDTCMSYQVTYCLGTCLVKWCTSSTHRPTLKSLQSLLLKVFLALLLTWWGHQLHLFCCCCLDFSYVDVATNHKLPNKSHY